MKPDLSRFRIWSQTMVHKRQPRTISPNAESSACFCKPGLHPSIDGFKRSRVQHAKPQQADANQGNSLEKEKPIQRSNTSFLSCHKIRIAPFYPKDILKQPKRIILMPARSHPIPLGGAGLSWPALPIPLFKQGNGRRVWRLKALRCISLRREGISNGAGKSEGSRRKFFWRKSDRRAIPVDLTVALLIVRTHGQRD